MGFGFQFTVKGDYALFTRPEFAVERVSYDVPTPSALVGLISSVYWHPGVKYIIDEIRIYHPVNFVNIRRNEVSDKLSPKMVKEQMLGTRNDLGIYTKESISQRASLLLKDVHYGVSAHFELTKEKDAEQSEEKVYAILSRRLKKGQYFSQPFLGCREFPARVEWVERLPESTLDYSADLGFMLYDLQYRKDAKGNALDSADPRFYRPRVENGVIDVQKWAKEGLRC
ncbi:MAG: type I-C CRISPR-associated protein Cas5 [Clostridia bacterium]|nr:type I-C CRISPR-associated protein Cas5 [Clostridia bacterium]